MSKCVIVIKLYQLILFTGLVLAGCQEIDDYPIDLITATAEYSIPTDMPDGSLQEPYVFPNPVPGTITVKGRLLVLDPFVMLPDPNNAIYMVPIPEEGEGVATIPAIVVGEVPQAEVDERTGDFLFTDLMPGRYAIVVLTTGGAQIPARYYDEGSLAILNIKNEDIDKIIELEFLSLP